MQYEVVVPMIVIDVVAEDGLGRRELYRGARFDSRDVSPESLDHLTDGGFVEKVQKVDLDAAIAASAKAGDAANKPAPAEKAPAKRAPAKTAASKTVAAPEDPAPDPK